MTTRSRAATSSPARSQRPRAGVTPSTGNSSAETRVPATRIGSPSPVNVNQWPSAYAATSSVRMSSRMLGERAVRIRAGDADEALGRRVGKRREQNAVHQAEDRGVGADAERQREHGDGREARAAPQHARAEAQVLREGVEHAVRRARRGSAPWRARRRRTGARRSPRLAAIHPAGGERVDLLLQVVLRSHRRAPDRRRAGGRSSATSGTCRASARSA